MRKALALTIVLGVLGAAVAQTAQHMPRGTATDIPNADIQTLAKSMASMPGGDKLLRVVGINNGEYNVGVAIVHRAKAASLQAGLEHNQITEIYHIISGSGTMVSGGTMQNAKDSSDPNTIAVVGPSTGGGPIMGGKSRKLGPGDVVIVPPNTAHGWSEVTDELVYLVVRMDSHKVLKIQ